MGIGIAIFIATAFTTFIVWELLVYAQAYTYPQWQWMDETNFLRTHARYVAKAGITTYTPILHCFLATALLLFVRPAAIPFAPVIALNVVNLVATLVTVLLPVPIHVRIDREQAYTQTDLRRLLRHNGVRVALSSVNTVIVLICSRASCWVGV